MKTKLLALMLLASGSMFAATRVAIGVNIGAPPPPPVAYYAPSSPGPGFVWVSGYYYPVGARYEWRAGYWTRPPYRHARWVAPRFERGRYFAGRWR